MKMYSTITKLLFLISLVFLSNATILITSPAINPFNQSKIPYVYTNVGTIPYGKTLTFDLLQKPDINFCLNPNQTTTPLFTQPTYVIINPTQAHCSYVTQALNAQSLGAKGVLIVSEMVNYFGNMVPIDDGNGRKVHISVLMIANLTYLQLQVIKNIQIKVQYEVYKSNVVNVTYFLSASGRANYIFLREFQPYYEKISDLINFRPIYLTFSCPFCPQKECLISSDYCLFQMDTYVDGVGQYILKQQLRQWNIYKQYGTSKYLSYMNYFDKLCTVNWFQSQNCGNNILNTMKLELSQNLQSPSQIMDNWRKDEIAFGFWTTPQLTINSQIYAGTQDPEDVFNAICQSLVNPPAACLGQTQIPNKKGNKLGWIIGSIIIACILSIGLGLLIYRRCVKKQLTKDMFSKVNQLVARYATRVSQHNKKRKQKLKMRLNQEL